MAFKSQTTADLGTTDTTVTATVASGDTATVIGFSIANTGSSTINVTAKLVKSGGDTAHLIKDAALLAGGAIAIIGGDQKHVLEAGDSIVASADVANQSDAIVSYLV